MIAHLLSCQPAAPSKIRLLCASAAILIGTTLLAFPASAQQRLEWPKEQTAELTALRISTSPAERKLSFNLLLISRDARHVPLGSFASSIDSSAVNPDGTVSVEVTAYLSPSLMASPVMANIVRVNGGVIPLPAYISDHLEVRVSKAQLLDLAANPNVLSIRQAHGAPSPSMVAANLVPGLR